MNEPPQPPPPPPWELKLKWVIATAAAIWLFGAAALLIYLFSNRGTP